MFEKTLVYADKSIRFLDQSQLPNKKILLVFTDYKKLITAIKKLQIRGAPAIGISGAYGMVIAAWHSVRQTTIDGFKHALLAVSEQIAGARPTAVNLSWAVAKMRNVIIDYRDSSVDGLRMQLENMAAEIMIEDIRIGQQLGAYGSKIIKRNYGVLTHCNAGGLATGGMGSALSLMYYAWNKKINFTVYVDETRPLLQGARLTTYELKNWKIPHMLICDNMAASLMKAGKIHCVIVGADRIASNGDAANKIGTYGAAVAAKFHNIPFFVAAPYSTFDLHIQSGAQIPIEERDSKEITHFRGLQIAPNGTKVFNPAFDVVPAGLITGLITEKGIIYKPNKQKILKIFKSLAV